MDERVEETIEVTEEILTEDVTVNWGDGSEENPFLISDVDTLMSIRDNLSACYKLVADIDLEGVEWEPIGTSSAPFTGTLDGAGYSIRNLKMNRNTDYAGLFGCASGAKIREIHIKNSEVTSTCGFVGTIAGYLNNCTTKKIIIKDSVISGKDYVGGLAGYISGGNVSKCDISIVMNGMNRVGGLTGALSVTEIDECCIKGQVKGSGNDIGGLSGSIGSSAKVSNSYVTGSVTSTVIASRKYVGGLVGYGQTATIRNCYAACNVSDGGKALIYIKAGVTITSSYYDMQIVGETIANESSGTGKVTLSMTRKDSFEGWDFEEIWELREGVTYPYLRFTESEGVEVEIRGLKSGVGTEEDPYLIDSLEGLTVMHYGKECCYRLIADVDMNGEEWKPIGTSLYPFTGKFDGAGYSIRNMNISGNTNYAGLFGYVEGARIENLYLKNCNVFSTGNYVGILVGYMRGGSVTRCSVQGQLTGYSRVGGLVGMLTEGVEVSECCTEGCIEGDSYVGALIGYANDSILIKNCYTSGSAIGKTISNKKYLGGLVGYGDGARLENSFAACNVGEIGKGLIDANSHVTVVNSYCDSQVAGTEAIDTTYNIGKLTLGMTKKDSFEGWDFEAVWGIREGVTYPYLKYTGNTGVVAMIKDVTEGEGTEADPYLIRTAEGLATIKCDRTRSYRLISDIDLEGVEWEPIGTSSMPFIGTFDGAGYTIRNLMQSFKKERTGLFGCARDALIKNVCLENCKVSSVENDTGILAGTIDNCTVANIVITECEVSGYRYNHVGILTGCFSGGSLSGCSVKGVVKAGGFVGGLIGLLTETAEINECCMEGDVAGWYYAGGLVGVTSRRVSINNSFAMGNVTITSNESSIYVGGLIGLGQDVSIKNCYAVGGICKKGKGLVSVWSNVTVENSYFDSVISGITTPVEQAKTTMQLMCKETYSTWDWENIWEHKEESYPQLRRLEFIKQKSFEISCSKRLSFSVCIEWDAIPGATEYILSYAGKEESSTVPMICISGLLPDTDYTFKVQAKMDDETGVWSKQLLVKTLGNTSISGLHSTEKGPDYITVCWKPVENVKCYEVICNGNIYVSDRNSYSIPKLYENVPYVIYVKALHADGSIWTSNPIVEKLYTLNPQTDYAKEFIDKCENQTWFIDEIENLLNVKGKSINTISSKQDFATIYAMGLANRGISGYIPPAIGELYQLKYLYLGNNSLNSSLPEEIALLDKLIEVDLTGNEM